MMIPPALPPKFKPGDKVICVDDDFRKLLKQQPHVKCPIKNQPYTVRQVIWIPSVKRYGLLLVEIKNIISFDPQIGAYEPSFDERRFVKPDELEDMEKLSEEISSILENEENLVQIH